MKDFLLDRVLPVAAFLALLAALAASLSWTDPPVFGGTPRDIQRIFYFHVGSAAAAGVGFLLVMVFSIVYLARRTPLWDAAAAAAAEVGLLFCTLVLVTGPIWAHPVWGTWWSWNEPRLTTTLVLWFLYAGYLILRWALPGHRGTMAAAVFGIIAFVDVPVVYFTARARAELYAHPVLSGVDAEIRQALMLSLLAFLLLFGALFRQRLAAGALEKRVEALEHEKGEEG